MWTTDEEQRLKERYGEAFASDPGGVVAGVRAVALLAVELVAARGGTMTEGELAEAREVILAGAAAYAHKDVANRWGRVGKHLNAQGATVATLQAKVVRLEKERETYAKESGSFQKMHADSFAEVERLKAELEGVTASHEDEEAAHAETLERMQAAESRLAAIRERASDAVPLHRMAEAGWCGVSKWDGDVHQDVRASNALPYLHYATSAAVRWVLEGDAPQEAKCTCHMLQRDTQWHDSDCPRAPKEVQDLVEVVTLKTGMVGGPQKTEVFTRYPCSDTCTHDDAATPGHPERVKGLSTAFGSMVDAASGALNDGHPDALPEGPLEVVDPAFIAGHEQGAEAMRAACMEAVQDEKDEIGLTAYQMERLKKAIEGAAP